MRGVYKRGDEIGEIMLGKMRMKRVEWCDVWGNKVNGH